MAILVEQCEDFLAPAWVMSDPGGVAVLHCGVIWPALRPIGAQSHEGMCGYASVPALPILHVTERYYVVRILRHFVVHVEHHQGQQHFLRLDLICRTHALMEMRRSIDVRTPLPDVGELLH